MGLPAQSGTSHALPVQPEAHAQRPGSRHSPLDEQPCLHTGLLGLGLG